MPSLPAGARGARSCLAAFATALLLTISLQAAEPRPSPPATTPPPLTIAGIGDAVGPIGDPWQFHVGDDPAFASPALDDSGWQPISVAATWGAQTRYPNHFAYTGFAWYRRHISVPAVAGSASPLGLNVPHIDDAYEVYWNGRLVGSVGHLPPHPLYYASQPPHTFLLGQERSGVLAIRIWKAPLESQSSGEEGGLSGPPRIGSTTAVALSKTAYDFNWLRTQLFYFGLNLLSGIVAVVAFLAWLHGRSQKLLFWIAVFCISPVVQLILGDLRLPIPYSWSLALLQPFFATASIALSFILLYLFHLETSRLLLRATRIFAALGLIFSVIDGTTSFGIYFGAGVQQIATVVDAVCTVILVLLPLYHFVLVGAIFVMHRRLDWTRWAVAIFAFLFEMLSTVILAVQQGDRFTHWSAMQVLIAPLFVLRGNQFSMQTLLATALFIAIVVAVIRFLRDAMTRQTEMEQEYLSAQELQRVLVPDSLPELPGYAVTSSYLPAQEVGGDFFQLIPWAAGDALLVLGDVSGKGLKAAMTVSLIVGTVRTLAEFVTEPEQILAGLNRRLYGRLAGGFVTCVLLKISPDGACALACAGHPAPILNGQELELPGALPLGLARDVEFEAVGLTLALGDHLTLYTDGLLEARDPQGHLFGIERVLTLTASNPDASIATQAAVDFGQDDDVTVLTLTRIAQGTRSSTTLNAPALA